MRATAASLSMGHAIRLITLPAIQPGDRPHHVFEKSVAVRCPQRRVVIPIHLELAVRVLVIVLIGPPPQPLHGVADLGDHVVAPHQRVLVVAGLQLAIGGVRDFRPIR